MLLLQQYSVVRSKRAFFNNARRFQHIALLRGMLYVINTAYAYCADIYINLDFSKKDIAQLKF